MKTNVVPLNGPNWRSPDLALVGDTGPAPAFPVDVLAGWADWCRDTADAANAPQDYVAASLITTGAALIGNARRVSFGSWTEPSTIWTVLVGSPSAKKSPAMAPSKRAVGLLEAELVAQQPNSQPSPQLRIGDVTAQAAAEVVAANPRGVLLQLDEVSGWWAQTNRSGGEQFWLEAFGGNSYVVNRKGKKAHRIENLTISVLGTVQPDPLRDLLQAKTDRGFAARYLYVFPDPITGFRRPKAVDDDAATNALRRLRDLSYTGQPEVCPLSLTAEEVAEAWLTRHVAETERSHGSWEQWLGKQNGMLLRYALTFEHLWWCMGTANGHPEPSEVSVEAVEAAAHFIDTYAKPMAARSFGAAARAPEEQRAALLARLLQRQEVSDFNAREVRRGALGPIGQLASTQVMEETLTLLENAFLVRKIGTRSGGTKGRAPGTYEVNPALLTAGGVR